MLKAEEAVVSGQWSDLISVFSFSVFSFFPGEPLQIREMPPGSQRRPVQRLALEQRGQVPAEKHLRLAHQVIFDL
jgi:hypothetical protein